jgi:hypothetical protein
MNTFKRIAAKHNAGHEYGNDLKDKKGNSIGFFETGEEQEDGAIVGTIMRYTDSTKTYAVPFQDFRINPDGTIAKFYGET